MKIYWLLILYWNKIFTSTFSIKAKKGDDLFQLIGEIFLSQNKKFIFNGHNFLLPNDLICHNINFDELLNYLIKNFKIVIKKNKNQYEIIDNNKPYWQKYNLNIINYNSFTHNKTSGENKSVNNPFHLHHGIESHMDVWKDLESNIKNITEKYIINKNFGFIALYTTKENHKLFENLLKDIKKQNNFFFVITIKFWVIKSSHNHHKNPIIIDNNFLEKIQNIIQENSKKNHFVINENSGISIESVYEHKLSTMNNIPITFNNQMEIINRYSDSHEYIVNHRRRDIKHMMITEKFFEGINLYIHPVFNGHNIIVYFLPNIIDRLGNNVFYNKSLSSTFIIKPKKEFILGGFTRNYKELKQIKIPWFKKIPIIKYFFKNENYINKQEKLIISMDITINYDNNI